MYKIIVAKRHYASYTNRSCGTSLRSAPQERASTGAMRTDALPCSALPFSQGVEREHSAEQGISAHSKDCDFQKFFRLRRNQFLKISALERRRCLTVGGHSINQINGKVSFSLNVIYNLQL